MKSFKFLFTALTFFALLLSAYGQSNPLWENRIGSSTTSLPSIDEAAATTTSASTFSAPQAQPANAEIAALAEALDNDPLKVFNYVRNTIVHETYYGIRKGAVMTLLEGSGNDMDQCLLLAALLEAAGVPSSDIQYRRGRHRIAVVGNNGVNVYDMLGLDKDPFPGQTYQQAFGATRPSFWSNLSELQAKQIRYTFTFLSNARFMEGWARWNSSMQIVWHRVWLRVTINGTAYELDPSFKNYETLNRADLLTAVGYNRSTLLSTAGGNTGTGYVQNLSEANVSTFLANLSGDIVDELRTNYPNLSVAEIVSGRRIIPVEVPSLSDAYPLKQYYSNRFNETNITSTLDDYKTTVRFQSGAIDCTIPTADLEGRRISLDFSGSNGMTANLRFDDDAPIDTRTVSGSEFDLTITVEHPGGLGNQIDDQSYKRGNGIVHTILYGFSPSGRLLQKRYEVLNDYLESGLLDSSREVRSELLNIMGLNWLYQKQLAYEMLGFIDEVDVLTHHAFGRMSQEDESQGGGFFVDVSLSLSGHYPRDGQLDDSFDNVVQLAALYASAFEHGVIEQMQPGNSGVSTANILRGANADGERLYLADSSNWNTVRNQINYTNAKETEFSNLINNSGARLFLPRNDDYSVGDWTGSGYIVRTATGVGMIISGNLNGGYAVNPATVVSTSIYSSIYTNPAFTYGSSSMPTLKPLPTLPTLPRMYGSDPVDMATGAFIYANDDMATGIEAAPRGLNFTRHYTSNTRFQDDQNIGYGWTHPLHIRVTNRTAVEEVLGLGTTEHAAGFLTSALVASDLYRTTASAKEWGVANLAVTWFTDLMTNSAVSITIGPDTFQFVRQPDGTFEPPAGSTMELTEVSGNYRLKQRLGNTIHFEDTQDSEDDGQRVQKIVDVDGKEMTFAYHSDDRIDYVEDAYGRRYTFGYNSNNQITTLTDSTGRSIGFRYDSEGNQDRYTDPEGKFTYYVYEASTDPDGATPVDPSGTEASEHLMVRIRNHDKEIVAQNIWDTLGRVKEQYLHGDTSKTWKLRYSGLENFEEDPEGGITTYLYDERGRPVGKIDAEGNKMTMQYDGQDQVVERVSGSGEITTFEYDSDHNLLQVNYPRGGGSTINVYDSSHRLDHTTDPEGNFTDFVYFTSGFNSGKNRPYQVIDPEGTTTFAYHEIGAAAGMVHTVTDDDGLVTENAYDGNAQPDWTDAPGDFRTDFQYTARGDLDWVEDPNDIRTDFTYNDRRQVTQVVTDKNGSDEATEDRAYDNQGRLLSVESPQDNGGLRVKQSYTYNPTDLLDSESLVNETAATTDDLVLDYVYDGRDWVDEIIDAADRQTNVIYFGDGEVDEVQKPATRTSSFIYDGDNRPLTRIEPGAPSDRSYGFSYSETLLADGDTTEGYPRSIFTDADSITATTEFNRLGQPRYYRNKKDNVFEFRYDGLGRRTHSITPLDASNNRATVTTYAHRGEIDTVTEPSGETATFAYHPTSGRLESATYSNGTDTEVVNYTLYDNNGNLKTLNEGAAGINRTYDNLNRVKSYTDINGNTIGYRYYDSGKVAKIIYPGGAENGVGHVEYTYWKTGRLKEVIDKLDSTTSPRITTNYWNNDGRLDRIVRPNGTIRKIKYDAAGRPEIVEEYTSVGQLIALYKNNYYASDELQWVYQLPKAQSAGAQPNVVNAMLYNADNQLSSFEGQSVIHDPDGNMTSGPLPNGSIGTYDFDIRNRLTAAGGITYGYDPEGERVSQSGAGGSISYVNENNLGLTKVLQRTNNGQTVRYVWGAGLLYEVNAVEEATYYHYDNYGSTIALTDDSEVVTDRVEYSPFGSIINREGTHDTPFLFTGFFGNQTDESGLIHMRARFYNPLIRRFVNTDPAQQGWNWYAYAAGNPLGFVDPTGLGNASVINAVQTGLSFLGMVPVVGFVADIANAGISVARGNYADASINLAAAVPGLGQAATGAKFAAAGFGVFGVIRTADRFGDSSSLWRVGKHGSMPSPRPANMQSHHGVNSVWMEANYTGYRASQAPAVLMRNDPNHNATRGLFNTFRKEIAQRQNVSPRNIDWAQVQPGTAWRLAEEQFEAARVPNSVRQQYFDQFNSFIEGL
ncbi:MAG: RHS repeat-associated core domain-containing protein [Verrucomicrobiota bacterium]